MVTMVSEMDEQKKRKVTYMHCPDCKGKIGIPDIDTIDEAVGCVIGCPACGTHLFVKSPTEVYPYDERRHKPTSRLPQ